MNYPPLPTFNYGWDTLDFIDLPDFQVLGVSWAEAEWGFRGSMNVIPG